tara:strand:+ start:93 stop:485 length:393 start_codon:yes stop_codon:yes gene_type:complete
MILANELNKPRKFVWGIEDCCLFSANIIKSITNIDIAKKYRGKYKTKIGAFRLIKRFGYKNLIECVDDEIQKHGFQRIHINMAQKGDVVTKKIDNDEIVGIMLNDVGVFLQKDKYVFTKRSELNLAWEIR